MYNKDILKKEVTCILRHNILEFWQKNMFCPEGGFYGAMTSDGTLIKDADRGAVLNARILWSFSAAYRVLGDEEYLKCATHAKDYLLAKFYSPDSGELCWSVNHAGEVVDSKNQFYALAFAIYGLTEYHRATADSDALTQAINLFRAIEKYSFDTESGGYIEARKKDWQEITDFRLSEKDDNAPLTMNTHLHILEAYTHLYRVCKTEEVYEALVRLIKIFTDRIYNPENDHLSLFFDMQWNKLDDIHSYGHDIEASWLILEAAQVAADEGLIEQVMGITRKVATAALEGLQDDGSLIYERHSDGTLDTDRHWWVQAECVVGLMWLAEYHGDRNAADMAAKCWEYIKREIIDTENGEWWWSRRADGSINLAEDKAGMWKCPYHNSRMCLEILGFV
ncbi:MAG: AGE family epimerase/isomerase [Rikenellaceae bacterium]